MILFLKSTLKRTVYDMYTTLNTMLKHGAFFHINIHSGLFIKQTRNCLKNEGIINFIKTYEFEDVVKFYDRHCRSTLRGDYILKINMISYLLSYSASLV